MSKLAKKWGVESREWGCISPVCRRMKVGSLALATLYCLLSIISTGCGRDAMLPEGFVGAMKRDTDGDGGADLWVLYRGRALRNACADTNFDGAVDIVLRERYGGISLDIDNDQDGRPEYEGYVQAATSEDFRREGPGFMLDTQASRPPHSELLEYEARLERNRSLEVLSRLGWQKVSLDDDGDAFREVVVVSEGGRLLRIDYNQPGQAEPLAWLAFKDGEPAVLAWRRGKVLVMWDVKGDVYAVDTDGDGAAEALISGAEAPKPDSEIFQTLLDSLTEVAGGISGAK